MILTTYHETLFLLILNDFELDDFEQSLLGKNVFSPAHCNSCTKETSFLWKIVMPHGILKNIAHYSPQNNSQSSGRKLRPVFRRNTSSVNLPSGLIDEEDEITNARKPSEIRVFILLNSVNFCFKFSLLYLLKVELFWEWIKFNNVIKWFWNGVCSFYNRFVNS